MLYKIQIKLIYKLTFFNNMWKYTGHIVRMYAYKQDPPIPRKPWSSSVMYVQ